MNMNFLQVPATKTLNYQINKHVSQQKEMFCKRHNSTDIISFVSIDLRHTSPLERFFQMGKFHKLIGLMIAIVIGPRQLPS